MIGTRKLLFSFVVIAVLLSGGNLFTGIVKSREHIITPNSNLSNIKIVAAGYYYNQASSHVWNNYVHIFEEKTNDFLVRVYK